MLRARPVAGDVGVAQRFMDLLEEFVWEPGLSVDDVREIRRTRLASSGSECRPARTRSSI